MIGLFSRGNPESRPNQKEKDPELETATTELDELKNLLSKTSNTDDITTIDWQPVLEKLEKFLIGYNPWQIPHQEKNYKYM